MPFEQKENTGSLFVNERKQQPNHPDYTGSVNVFGEVFQLAGWKKESKNGKKYLSLSIKRKQDREPGDEGGGSPEPF